MNDQPNPSQFRPGLGAPPSAPAGPSRLIPWIKTAMTGGLLISFGLYAAQIILPYDWKPGVVAGRAGGQAVGAETEAMRDIRLDYENRLAILQNQASAKAQTDVLAAQQALQERTAGLAGKSSAAAISDWGCLIGIGVAGATDHEVPARFRGRDASDDLNDFFRGMARATCGQGDRLRQEVTQSQLDAIRTTAAARGAPMTNGAVQVAAAPPAPATQAQPVAALPALPHTLDEVYAINTPSRHYQWADVMNTRDYIRTLPQPVQDRLFAGLNDGTGASWDVLVDRAHAYLIVASIK